MRNKSAEFQNTFHHLPLAAASPSTIVPTIGTKNYFSVLSVDDEEDDGWEKVESKYKSKNLPKQLNFFEAVRGTEQYGQPYSSCK